MNSKLIAAIYLASKANAALNSLSDCLAVAALFDNTCSSTTSPIDLETHNGETMSCTGTMSCPGSSEKQQTFTSGSPCEF